jgi:hypothetical protein
MLRDILARMRHDGCGGLAAKAELLTGDRGRQQPASAADRADGRLTAGSDAKVAEAFLRCQANDDGFEVVDIPAGAFSPVLQTDRGSDPFVAEPCREPSLPRGANP